MVKIHGLTVDNESRCEHYHTPLDIIAIKFKCCDKFYPCYKCHNECEKHDIKRWINLNLMNMRYFVGFVKKQFLSMIIC